MYGFISGDSSVSLTYICLFLCQLCRLCNVILFRVLAILDPLHFLISFRITLLQLIYWIYSWRESTSSLVTIWSLWCISFFILLYQLDLPSCWLVYLNALLSSSCLAALYLGESSKAWVENIPPNRFAFVFCEAPPNFTHPSIYVYFLASHILTHTSSVNSNLKCREGRSVVMMF